MTRGREKSASPRQVRREGPDAEDKDFRPGYFRGRDKNREEGFICDDPIEMSLWCPSSGLQLPFLKGFEEVRHAHNPRSIRLGLNLICDLITC